MKFQVANRNLNWLVCLLLLLAASAVLPAQEAPSYGSVPREKTAESQAEREAEQRVSLSADKIIDLLQSEPGLLLQVKKRLVREAFDQGRLLDPADLTDEALFRLLREEDNIRILATQEIEDRYYVRPKPSKEELARQSFQQMQRIPLRTAMQEESNPAASPASAADVQGTGASQEERYWSRQESAPPMQNPPPEPAPGQDAAPPQYAPPPANGASPASPARQLNQAGLETPSQDSFENSSNMAGDDETMPRVRPEELPQLLQASASDLSGAGARERNPQQLPGNGVQGGASNTGSTSSANPFSSWNQQFPERASLDPRLRQMPPPPDATLSQPVIRHRANPYANVPSLYDLYSQVSRRSPVLERFGADIFRDGTGNLQELPMDLPVGPDYVLGPGDGLNIELWGSVSQRLQRVVDREGEVALPEAGPLQVSGRSLGEVQRLMQGVMREQYRDVDVDISLGRLRTVRVYIVGDVQRPGAYDISSLSTPLNALYAAGGPSAGGSLRTLQHYRGKQLVQEIDTYDMLLHGVSNELQRIQAGDIIKVPPIGPEVTVQGMVRRPAIYELEGKSNLAEVLELAGGVLPSGALRHIDVERLVAHENRTMLRLDLPETNDAQAVNKALQDFQVEGEDKISISPIVSYTDKTIYLDGHVFHPGKYPYRGGMTVGDLVQANQLLPEPSRRHAEIIRLQPPDYTPVVLAFNLGEVLDGNNKSLALQPFDTVRIFGRYDFEDPPVVSVSGEVRDPGDHITNGVTRLRDAIYLAGGLSPDAELEDAQVFRRTTDGKMRVISVDLTKALSGDQANDVLLEPKDRIFIHRNLSKTDPPAVTVQGEVAKPGKYPLGDGMTAAELVRVAGGLKRSADSESADLTSYLEQAGQKRVGEQQTIDLAKAIASGGTNDPPLKDGDVLTVPQIAGWNDIGASITVKGEVMRPGTYGIREGEKLSSIMARAGGFRGDAYPYGAILERAQVRELEEKNRVDWIRRVQSEGDALKLTPDTNPDEKAAKEVALAQWHSAIDKLENTPPVGRLVIHISPDTKRWANTPFDLPVRAGDVLLIPKQPNFVMVDGSVYNPTAITFRPGKNADWYLHQAGGPTPMANRRAVFVIRANGAVVGGTGSMFEGGALSTELRPGDLVMMPEKAIGGNTKWKSTLEASQLIYSIGVAIQVARSF